MNKSYIIIIWVLFCLLTQNIVAQRIITLETEGLHKGDSCALYYYKNGMPVLLTLAAVNEPGKIIVTDTAAVMTEGIYMLMLPPSITKDPIPILYSKKEEENINVQYYEHNKNVIFKNSEQNNIYTAYIQAAQKFYSRQHNLEEDFLNTVDSIERKKIRNKAILEQQVLYDYGKRIGDAYKGSTAEKIISCVNMLPIPDMAWDGEHLMYPIEDKKYQNAVNFVREHYWDGVNFKDNILLNTPYLSGKMTQYISLFNVKDHKNVVLAINDVLQKASVNSEMYHVVEEALLNLYLMKNSGFFSEELGIQILKNEQNQSFTPDWRREVISSRISFIEKNKLGTTASDLPLIDQNGKKRSLLNNKSKYTILYFFDPDCSRCMQVSPIVKDWLSNAAHKNISFQAIYIDNNEKEWRKYIKENTFPQNWLNLWGSTDFVKIRTQYWIDSIPSIYLLDENKKIILKDVSYKQLIDYFSKE